jgi:VanZ family protein
MLPDFANQFLFAPTSRQRIGVAALLVLLIINLFYHGAQPYAVNLFKAPWDKVVHFIFFGGVAGFLWVMLGARAAWLAVLGVALIGAADEIAQAFHPGRSADFADWVADVTAAAFAVAVLTALRRIGPRRRRTA